MGREAQRRWLRWGPIVAVGWLAVTGLILLQVWPSLPRTPREWGVLVAAGPPAYVLGELAVPRVLAALERGRLPKWARPAVLLLMAVAGFLLMILLWWVARTISAQP